MARQTKRKTIPKSVRFEVFKRDKFTCQYCGESAPNVILEVDHITPVAKGGDNEIMNLITSCRDCNRGKTDKKLDDNTAVMVQKKQLDAMQDRREQLEMMLQWRQALEQEIEIEIDAIDVYFQDNTKWGFSDEGRRVIRKLIKRFGFTEVYAACEISIDKYYNGTERSWDNAVEKVGGICYNRRKAAESDA
jgi:hypothetical protein